MPDSNTVIGRSMKWTNRLSRGDNRESQNAGTWNGTRNGSNVVSHRKLYRNDQHELPRSLSLENTLDRSRDVFPLEPVNRFALTEVNIAKQNSQLFPMKMSLPDFARLQYITTCMQKSCKIGIPISRRKRPGLYSGFLRLYEITTIRPS